MAKMNRGLNAATKRRGMITNEQLELFIAGLRGKANTLETMLISMPARGVQMDGVTKGPRAMELLDDYVFLVNEAVTN